MNLLGAWLHIAKHSSPSQTYQMVCSCSLVECIKELIRNVLWYCQNVLYCQCVLKIIINIITANKR